MGLGVRSAGGQVRYCADCCKTRPGTLDELLCAIQPRAAATRIRVALKAAGIVTLDELRSVDPIDLARRRGIGMGSVVTLMRFGLWDHS